MTNEPALHLIFAELPPGLNGRKGLLRMHWTVRRELMLRWITLVREAIEDHLDMPPFSELRPCRIIVERHDWRKMDWDNLGASLKPILDGLVHNKMLVDDSPDVVLSLTLRQRRPNKGQKPHLHVMLFEEKTNETAL